jgi:hypothetical protein
MARFHKPPRRRATRRSFRLSKLPRPAGDRVPSTLCPAEGARPSPSPDAPPPNGSALHATAVDDEGTIDGSYVSEGGPGEGMGGAAPDA